tara:strand:+ start:207 stop:893 length:687 start_codon:yes stop_codon:yes gene_type:complete
MFNLHIEWFGILGLVFILSASSFVVFFDNYLRNGIKKIDNSVITDKYEDRYVEYLDNIKERILSEDELIKLNKSVLLEHTPMGYVVLFYDHKNECFSYFSDRKDIPYKFLDAVARKYIKTFQCKMIYIFLNDELENQKKKYKEIVEENKIKELEEETHKKKDVFATYKSYNIKSDKPLKDTDYLIKENINKFKWRGFLKDYMFLQKVEKKKEDLSYQDFVNSHHSDLK